MPGLASGSCIVVVSIFPRFALMLRGIHGIHGIHGYRSSAEGLGLPISDLRRESRVQAQNREAVNVIQAMSADRVIWSP